MNWRSRYRLTLWSVVAAALALSAVLGFSSYRILKADSDFTQLILDENKRFLVNTLRSSHGMMMRESPFPYDEFIQLALKSRFIRYVALLDDQGRVVAHSKPLPHIPHREAYPLEALSEGAVLERGHSFVVAAFQAPGIQGDMNREGHAMMSYMPAMRRLPEVGWYILAMDTSVFHRHYHDTVVQSVASAVAVLLIGVVILVLVGILQRYQLAHLSLERLAKIKRALANFVPSTARKLIEANPDLAVMEKVVEDATVLFIDIEGFTHLVQRFPLEVINRNIEAYFSCFYEFIQAHSGDINETAGDGMMVIFHDTDPLRHAINAVQVAQKIRVGCLEGKEGINASERIPLVVNMGISSGRVHLGSTKMRASGGDRWTFTASGPVTVLAARLCQHARGGQILLSQETAKRIQGHLSVKPLGRLPLKNIQDPVEVFQLEAAAS